MKHESELVTLFFNPMNSHARLQRPFVQDGYLFASDTIVLLRIDASVVEGDYVSYDDWKMKCCGLFPSGGVPHTLTLSAMKEAIDKVETVEDMEDCKECDGTGVVLWNYTDSNNKEHEEEHDCPLCKGLGGFVIGKRPDPMATFNVWGKPVAGSGIYIIAKAMELMEVDSISVEVSQQERSPLVFRLTPHVDALVMPLATFGGAENYDTAISLMGNDEDVSAAV